MYQIIIENDGERRFLHTPARNSTQKITAGNLTEETGATPKLNCTILPDNLCYTVLHERTTLLTLQNTVTQENEFEGYILRAAEQFTGDGKLCKKLVCEGFQGYLCDTVQMYHTYTNTAVSAFLTALLTAHNAQSEPCKQIFLGEVNVVGNMGSMTTAYRSTWGEIKENLLDRLGGEIRVRRGADGRLYLDYLNTVTHPQANAPIIALANNLRSLSVETDTANIVTRLILLGAKVSDETAERLTIVGAVIDGQTVTVPYIDDAAAITKYGVIVGTVEFDDITVKENLYARGAAYLAENNRLKKHYKAGVLDISGCSLYVGNTYHFINKMMNFDEYLRLLRKTTDLLKPYTPTVEIGDKTEKLSTQTAQNRQLINYELPKQMSQTLQAAKDIATSMIEAATTGYVVVRPNEILIMDTDDVNTATKVWRMNSGGIGYSSTGYHGTYGLAMTMNGEIVADFITAGHLRGIDIQGCHITAGGMDDRNGTILIKSGDSSGYCVELRRGGIYFGYLNANGTIDYYSWFKDDTVYIVDGRETRGLALTTPVFALNIDDLWVSSDSGGTDAMSGLSEDITLANTSGGTTTLTFRHGILVDYEEIEPEPEE